MRKLLGTVDERIGGGDPPQKLELSEVELTKEPNTETPWGGD